MEAVFEAFEGGWEAFEFDVGGILRFDPDIGDSSFPSSSFSSEKCGVVSYKIFSALDLPFFRAVLEAFVLLGGVLRAGVVCTSLQSFIC